VEGGFQKCFRWQAAFSDFLNALIGFSISYRIGLMKASKAFDFNIKVNKLKRPSLLT
jgi:hypothetical protein